MAKPEIPIGPTTIVGWLTALAGLVPVIIKTAESGTAAIQQLNEPEEVAALVGLVAFGIAQLGRYWQAARTGAPGPEGPPGPAGPTGVMGPQGLPANQTKEHDEQSSEHPEPEGYEPEHPDPQHEPPHEQEASEPGDLVSEVKDGEESEPPESPHEIPDVPEEQDISQPEPERSEEP
ncbi:MAG: hypothetical protein FWD42_01710 [Solirubrobacterales bacterium]|nr:hypothetical protein [Solirubrobacterales bacterium]